MDVRKRKVWILMHTGIMEKKLAPDMYVWTDNNTMSKINILHGLFAECNIPASELVFEFRPDTEGDDEE